MSDGLLYALILLSALIILLDIWAIVSVFRSSRHVAVKAAWAIGISLFPVVGLIVWALVGPRSVPRATS